MRLLPFSLIGVKGKREFFTLFLFPKKRVPLLGPHFLGAISSGGGLKGSFFGAGGGFFTGWLVKRRCFPPFFQVFVRGCTNLWGVFPHLWGVGGFPEI